jgi:hypothetical protein
MLVGLGWLIKYQGLRVHYIDRRVRVTHFGTQLAAEEIVTAEVTGQKV